MIPEPITIAVMIANAKIQALRIKPEKLSTEAEKLVDWIKKKASSYSESSQWMSVLPNASYLERWFKDPVLTKIATINISGNMNNFIFTHPMLYTISLIHIHFCTFNMDKIYTLLLPML